MAIKVSSLQCIASTASRERVRDLVLPPEGGNRGSLGVIFHERPPWLVDITTAKRLDVPFDRVVVGLAFRPVDATANSGARNQEVALVYGDRARVEFYDLALEEWLEPVFFARGQCAAYSQQGDKLALGSASGHVVVLDLNSGHKRKELFNLQLSRSAIVRVEFSGHGESVWALTAGGAVYSVELSGGKAVEMTVFEEGRGADFECWAHALNRHAALAVFAGSCNRKTGTCDIWLLNLENGRRRKIASGHTRYVRRLQFIGDQQLLVLGDSGAELYDLPTLTRCSCPQAGESLEVAYSGLQFGDCAYVVGTADQ